MASVTRMLREERLRYAVKRETDRQSVELDPQILGALVDCAMSHIDSAFPDEDARMDASERAEKSLHPIIAALSEQDFASFAEFAAATVVREFPWTKASPEVVAKDRNRVQGGSPDERDDPE